MMRFTCGECGKRFSTADEPEPGRVYRIPCECGSTIVVEMDAQARPPPLTGAPRRSAPTEPLPLEIPIDDPFLRAALDSPWQEPVASAVTTPAAPLRLARRDPDYAARDEAPEPFVSYASCAELSETTRPTRLAGTRALLLDRTAGLREILGARVRQFLQSRRLVAGAAVLGIIAFALGVWVGSASSASRVKAKAATMAAAEAGPGAAGPSPRSVAALEPVAAPAAAPAPAAIAAGGEAPSAAAPVWREPKRRRGGRDADPASVRPVAIEEPTANVEPVEKTDEVPAAAAKPESIHEPAAEEPPLARNPEPD